jgi:hypothetical protein
VAEQLAYPERPTTVWGPGQEVTLKDVVTLPAGTPPGEYRLRVAMVEPENPSLRVQLGIAGQDAEGRYDLCSLSAERRPAGTAVAYDEGFEQGTAGWTAAQGMTARTDATAHGGKGCLLVSGTQSGKAWSYAQFTLRQPVLPASRYRLSCWMRVENISSGAPAPYLKTGLSDAQGKWLTNIQTNSYDLTRLGTWQRLIAMVETTPNTAGGHLAIEKGTLEGRITATIRLDDVRLELLESP